MKYRLVLTLFFCTSFTGVGIRAQDVDPPKATFTNATAAHSIVVRQQPRRFVFGWGTGALPPYRDTSAALHVNTILMLPYIDVPHSTNRDYRATPDSTKLIYANYRFANYETGIALQFDPTEENTIADWNGFTPRTYDTSGAAFGFATRYGMGIVPHDSVMTSADTSSNPVMKQMKDNYNRYMLFDADYDTAGTGGAPLLVLSQPKPDNYLLNPMRVKDDFKSAMWSARQNNQPLFLRDNDRYGGGHTSAVYQAGDSVYFQARGDSTEWYLAVNLRRWRNDDQDAVADTATVLSLRVPLVLRIDTVYYHGGGIIDSIRRGGATFNSYVLFDSAATLTGDTVLHTHYGYMDNTLGAVSTTEFRVRKGMLPTPSSLIGTDFRPDITLSAHFWLPRLIRNARHRPYSDYHDITDANKVSEDPVEEVEFLFRPLPDTAGWVRDTVVVSAGMEVYYHGNVDVGIDWLRFENRMARHLLRGYKDSHIASRTQDLYDTLNNHIELAGRGMSLYRHYFIDEVPASFWRVQRHIHRLLEDAGTCENDQVHTPHHIHQTYVQETWKGWFGTGLAGAPYYRFGGREAEETESSYDAMPFRTMNIGMGYRGAYRWNGSAGVLWSNSNTSSFSYETGRGGSTSLYDTDDSTYRTVIANAAFTGYLQAVYERALILKLQESPSAYYSGKPLWTQLWPMSRFYSVPVPAPVLAQLPAGSSAHAFMLQDRPHTGEEIRFEIWMALALGTKALTYFSGGSGIYYNGAAFSPGSYLGLTRQYRGDPHSAGAQFRLDSLEGGDFLDTNDIIRRYLHVPEVAGRLGVDTNRLYVGTHSVRNEVRRIHDFVYDNEQHFLALQLQAVYAKGFKLIAHSRDAGVNLGSFFDTTTTGGVSQFHVRPVHDRSGNAWTGGDEPFKDSTFFLVTLLKDTAKSMSDLYYVAVVNRRTDPTVYHTGSTGTNLGDSIRFFSTAEFDSLAAAGDFSSYAEPQYAQHGSRSIALPFRFDQLLQDSVHSLVRIREVGGTLDTIVGETYLNTTGGDFPLRLKFKPGEGKLLRVNVLHPGTVPEGLLAYSNQRKMVCVPDSDDSTKVRYHIVYHRPEDGHNEVFYRYSKALSRNSDEANVVWEAEIPISHVVIERVDPPNIGIVHYHLNCAYPSVVVRQGTDGRWSYHIVYACEHPDSTHNEQFIVEHQMTITNSNPPVANQTNFVVDTIAGRTLDVWGTPVLGAVRDGTIYAWADSVDGIVVSYKPQYAQNLTSQRIVRFSELSDSCQHPSLATYSRYTSGERSTALVWQEDEKIYYASPYIDSSGVLQLHTFPVSYPSDSLSWLPHNADTTILSLCSSSCTFRNRLPVVYRGIETSTNTIEGGGLITLDRIAWEGRRTQENVASMIATRWVDFVADTTTAYWPYILFLRSGLNKLYSVDPTIKHSFHAPDLAQGALGGDMLWNGETGTAINNSDSAFVLSFHSSGWTYSHNIWHLPFSYTNSGRWDVINPVDLQQDHTIGQEGVIAHQAARPAVEANTWWRNRRVFEFSQTPKILSSAQYFYRSPVPRNNFSLAEVMAFSKNCNSIGIFEPVIGAAPVRMRPKTGAVHASIDTLISDTFPMGGPTEVSFYVTGSDTSLAKVELVNTHTGTRATITLLPATATTAILVAETFTNGGGYLYRLEFLRKSTQAEYSVDMLAGQIPLQSSTGTIVGYAKSADTEHGTSSRIVNLAVAGKHEAPGLHAYVFPNPAQERISVSVYRTYAEHLPATDNRSDEKLIVRIISILGAEVRRFDARTGVALELPIKHLPKGVYFVRVEQAGNPQENGTTSFTVE